MGFELRGGQPAPNTKLLPSVDGVVPAGNKKWTICTRGFGSLDSLFSDFPVWQVLREEDVRKPLTRHLTDSSYSKQQVAGGVSVVEHTVILGG